MYIHVAVKTDCSHTKLIESGCTHVSQRFHVHFMYIVYTCTCTCIISFSIVVVSSNHIMCLKVVNAHKYYQMATEFQETSLRPDISACMTCNTPTPGPPSRADNAWYWQKHIG